ncbi:MAG: hypothetical protein ACI857_000125 [Arenicella sp.]|jgi:hypothetical protein
MQEVLNPVQIEKESIKSLSFKKMIEFEQHPALMSKLTDATRLGNIDKFKCQIEFYSDSGLKTVQTTVWATGKSFICLKGGVWIPISKIVDIRMI